MYREENIVRGGHFYTFPPRMRVAIETRVADDSVSAHCQSKAAPESRAGIRVLSEHACRPLGEEIEELKSMLSTVWSDT
jgi:hypothetical protein